MNISTKYIISGKILIPEIKRYVKSIRICTVVKTFIVRIKDDNKEIIRTLKR